LTFRALGRNHIASTPVEAIAMFVLIKQSDSPCPLQLNFNTIDYISSIVLYC